MDGSLYAYPVSEVQQKTHDINEKSHAQCHRTETISIQSC
ncbi:uncharacterized protein J3R85_005968 [Psidium guajava]|nr:uncharacterized protein J3R85_005968 [Psidium guajava]